MFNALNRFISRLDSEAPSPSSSHGAFGFQVLRNKNAELAIEPWFDFIIGINGRMIVYDPFGRHYIPFLMIVRTILTPAFSRKK
jgi:hypothetical protein